MPRKHLIASGINKKQQQQAKIWMKCAKEIKAAAKVGGPNQECNPRLKAAVIRGLQCNLSRDSIEKNINGASKDPNELKELIYEGYGPEGMAIMVKVLTDNDLRAISSIRGYFSKLTAQLSKPNSVSILFEEKSEFIIESKKYSEDFILNIILELNILDFISEEDCYIIYGKKEEFFNIKDSLEKNNIEIFASEIKYIPENYIKTTEKWNERIERFISNCENDDDIQ